MYIISKLFEQEMSCVQYRRNKPLINGEEHPTEMVSYGAGLGNTAAVSYLWRDTNDGEPTSHTSIAVHSSA